MDEKYMNHILKYPYIYEYLSTGAKSEKELREYLENVQNKKRTTLISIMDKVKATDDNILMVEGDLIFIDEGKEKQLVHDLITLLRVPLEKSDSHEVEQLQEEMKQMQNQMKQLQQVVDQHKQEAEDLKNQLEDSVKKKRNSDYKNKKLRSQIKELEEKNLELEVEQKVLLTGSVAIGPVEDRKDRYFLDDTRRVLNVKESVGIHGGIRESFLDEIPTDQTENQKSNENRTVGRNLDKCNYALRTCLRIMTDKLLNKRIRDVSALQAYEQKHFGKRKHASKTEQHSREPLSISREISQTDSNRKRLSEDDLQWEKIMENSRLSIQSILDNSDMTNQEKLALYAFNSDCRNTDMEYLINFAGNNCVNANELIWLLENSDARPSYESMKEMLRQLANPSEYRMKLDLARELIAGEWYITADYNGKKEKFQLVPIGELNEIRERMNLGPSRFQYRGKKKSAMKQDEEIKDNIAMAPENMDFKRYPIGANEEDESPGFDDKTEV